MKKIPLFTKVSSAILGLGMASASHAAVLLSTDFANTGVTAGDMTGVTWTENGLLAPTTLSASAAVRSGLTGDADAEGGYFSGNVNVGNPNTTEVAPAWSTTWTITVGASDVSLANIVLVSTEANSGGAIGAGNGTSNIKLSIVGNSTTFSTPDLTEQRLTEPDTLTYTFASPLALTASNTYDVTFTVWENSSSGHFEAFDSVAFNGDVIPEPSVALLGGFGFLALLRRRR